MNKPGSAEAEGDRWRGGGWGVGSDIIHKTDFILALPEIFLLFTRFMYYLCNIKFIIKKIEAFPFYSVV